MITGDRMAEEQEQHHGRRRRDDEARVHAHALEQLRQPYRPVHHVRLVDRGAARRILQREADEIAGQIHRDIVQQKRRNEQIHAEPEIEPAGKQRPGAAGNDACGKRGDHAHFRRCRQIDRSDRGGQGAEQKLAFGAEVEEPGAKGERHAEADQHDRGCPRQRVHRVVEAAEGTLPHLRVRLGHRAADGQNRDGSGGEAEQQGRKRMNLFAQTTCDELHEPHRPSPPPSAC